MEHSIWPVVIPNLFNFSVACAILYFAVRKAFTEAIALRSEKVGAQVVEAEKAFSEASIIENEWKAKASGAKSEVEQLYGDANASLDRQKKATGERAKREGERIRQEAKLVAQSELTRVIHQLQKEFAHQSVDMAGKYLEGHLAEDDRKSLVKNYTEIVGHGTSR